MDWLKTWDYEVVLADGRILVMAPIAAEEPMRYRLSIGVWKDRGVWKIVEFLRHVGMNLDAYGWPTTTPLESGVATFQNEADEVLRVDFVSTCRALHLEPVFSDG